MGKKDKKASRWLKKVKRIKGGKKDKKAIRL